MFFKYNGRGISKKEAAERNYFDILYRHFWHICGASFWLALSNILFFGGAGYLFLAYLSGDNLTQIIAAFLNGQPFILPIIPFLPLMLTGPFTAGFTYVIRNYAKQEHTFLMSDFFYYAKQNWKQALITSVLTTLVSYLFLQALVIYNSFFANTDFRMVLYCIFAIVAMLLIIMSFYIYPIMVTFKMKFKVVLKNAWTFTILKLPQNFLIFVFLLFINGGIFYVTTVKWYLPELWLILTVFFLTGFTAYTANYYIWHVLDKYIVRLVTPKDEERIFTDEEHIDNNIESMEDYDDDYDF